MVIGNGLVANAFAAYEHNDNYLVFASGVSNSANKDLQEFEREKLLLGQALKENKEKHFIYFSTCSLYDDSLKNSLYATHKLNMEALIKKAHSSYHIFRISNLAGKTNNPNTVLNFFYQHILSGEHFHIWKDAARNIIDIDDAVVLCDYIVKHKFSINEVINIANPENYPVQFIIEVIEQFLLKKGKYDIIDKLSFPEISVEIIKPLYGSLNILFDKKYLERTLQKYYL